LREMAPLRMIALFSPQWHALIASPGPHRYLLKLLAGALSPNFMQIAAS